MRKGAIFVLIVVAATGCKKEKKAAKKESPPHEAKTGKTEPPPPPPSRPQIVKIDGFKTPESIFYDEANDVYLVSNINGKPGDKDDNGFIAKVSPPPDAKIVEPAWIDGKNEKVTLNAPKGMAILDGVLYVSDIDVVRMFDAKTGEPKGEIALKGATFVNDLSVGKGVVYASDTALDAEFKPGPTQGVWEIKGGKAKQLAKGAELGGPNGVLAQGEDLWVVTFATGELYKLKGGKREAVEKLPKGQLDGIVATGDGRLVISSWEGKTFFHGKPGQWTQGPPNLPSPADIGIDVKRNLVLVPIFTEDRIEMHDLPMGAGGGEPPAEEPTGAVGADGAK